MNQIIYPEKVESNIISYENNQIKKKKIYKSLFIFSLFALIIFISYYMFLYFRLLKKAKVSKNILGVYDIQRLYSINAPVVLPNVILENGESADVLGVIQIEKINLRYPILSKTTDDFLEIAPCKFYGGNLNDYGNFCITGHNYDNNELFSNLKFLEINDIIKVYNLDGSYVAYKIYDKFETVASDTSCIKQNESIKEITLITCNNSNKKRLIIKAKQNR